MGNIMIMNASPRAPKSNSKQYARIFSENCHMQTEYFNLTKTNHMELAHTMERFSMFCSYSRSMSMESL